MSKIPPQAQKVFSGKIFDVYQWEQEMYDGSTATFEKLKRPDTVVIVAITEDGQILVTREEQPTKPVFTSLPGGRVEEGEEPALAAARELLEETGYATENLTLWLQDEPVSKMEWTIYTYIAKSCKKIAEQKLDAGEKIELQLVNFEEFTHIALQDNFNELSVKLKFLEAKADPANMASLRSLLS